jgi:hypothetical protein
MIGGPNAQPVWSKAVVSNDRHVRAARLSREVARNCGRRRYRACRADRAALRRMRRPKIEKLARCRRLRAVVEEKLELRWSPEQIAGWPSLEYPDDPEMRVSHETIYLSLFVQTRGALRQELTRYLRHRHSTRRPGGKPLRNGQATSPPGSTSATDPPQLTTALFPATGKATCCAGKAPASSRPSSNDNSVRRYTFASPTDRRQRACATDDVTAGASGRA